MSEYFDVLEKKISEMEQQLRDDHHMQLHAMQTLISQIAHCHRKQRYQIRLLRRWLETLKLDCELDDVLDSEGLDLAPWEPPAHNRPHPEGAPSQGKN